MEHDGSRVGDAASGGRDHAFGFFDLGCGEAAIDLPIEAGDEPLRGQTLWSDKDTLAARGKLGGDHGRQIGRGGFDDFGIVLAQALD